MGTEPPRGSSTWNGMPAAVCGPQFGKTRRSTSLVRVLNIPRTLSIVAAFPSGESFLDAYQARFEGCLVIDASGPGMKGIEVDRIELS